MNIEEKMLERAGKEMANEIDKEILWGMLVGIGWTRVLLPNFNSREHADDLIKWLADNCKNPYERKGSDVIFEKEHDAVNFILRWK